MNKPETRGRKPKPPDPRPHWWTDSRLRVQQVNRLLREWPAPKKGPQP